MASNKYIAPEEPILISTILNALISFAANSYNLVLSSVDTNYKALPLTLYNSTNDVVPRLPSSVIAKDALTTKCVLSE